MTADVLVVGTGLIGTSLGLALVGAADVVLDDPDRAALATAVARGAGRRWDGRERVGTVVVCAPAPVVAAVVERLLSEGTARTYTHVASVQAPVQRELERRGWAPDAVCGGHPMAGRERSGPEAASADLFAGRPWVLCPGERTGEQAVADVAALAAAVGAQVTRLRPEEHDAAVALVSHLPQLASSALAAQLAAAGPGAVALAGPGLQDTTRVAGSDPRLWRDVLRLNAANVAPLVRALAADLAKVADALDAPVDLTAVTGLLERGAAGRALVPVKRGERDAAFVTVAVAVPDRPGQIAALLTTAGDAGVNVEDVRVDHVPGRPRGVVGLSVRAETRAAAEQALRAGGWDVLSGDAPGDG